MGEAIGQVLPLAIGVSLSPFPIIGVVLMLGTPRARVNGPAFLVGWVAGMALVGTVVLLLSGGVGASDDGQPSTAVSVAKIAIGALLLGVAVKQWRARPRAGEAAEMPAWMQSVDHFRAPRAAGLGFLLAAVNPKNLLLVVAAAAAIAGTGIPGDEQALAYALFVVLGTIGPAAPVAIYFALGARSERLLDELRAWMAHNNAAIMAVICLLIAAKLIGDGVSGL
jgi:threonine/homoserine/homoserine lactone efflux protein